MLGKLRGGFARLTSIAFSLASIRHFPDVLYLAPDPAEPFRALTHTISAWYPETPPYGGRWPDIIPHLTVVSVQDRAELERIADEFVRASRSALPIRATANEVTLLEMRSGRWTIRASFELGVA